MIDEQGYRPNVGIVLINDDARVFWAKRRNSNGWQFPQGGVHSNETPEQAMYRELREEVGLEPQHVEMLGRTRDWLRYDIPEEFRRRGNNDPRPGFRGQKQVWFLLRLTGSDRDVRLDTSHKPEFEDWRWIDYWCALDDIIAFKRDVYRLALTELEPLLRLATK
jgi:putative (di)nucleoside polyphosphate hydrolase